MSETSAELLALMNGYGLILDTLIRRLCASGLLSQDDIADELGKLAQEIEVGWKDAYAPTTPRLDVSVVRQLSRGLRDVGQPLTTKWGYREDGRSDPPANNDGDPEQES